MELDFLYGREQLKLNLPDDTLVYKSHFPVPEASADQLVAQSLDKPFGSVSFDEILRKRNTGSVVIIVSDITRPIPYSLFLPQLLNRIESAGMSRDGITILVATGMHRCSSRDEYLEMFGEFVTENYRIIDHRGDEPEELVEIPGKSWSGNTIRLNRHLVNAGLRITTGLVEPHFMAGFSGGRKAVCPGCSSLETVRNFHGEPFLADSAARNANLTGNPLHLESLSVARALGVDFSVNVVLDQQRAVVKVFSGEIEEAHKAACDFAAECACPVVSKEADLVITSSGGYPLDATFYQCVKGFVSCLSAVKERGTVIAFGACSEGIGGSEYSALMREFGGGKWQDFLKYIKTPGVFIKDQWQYQMHCRTLRRIGEENLKFITSGLSHEQLKWLSVTPYTVSAGTVQRSVQKLIDESLVRGETVAAFPEGPYCAPFSE